MNDVTKELLDALEELVAEFGVCGLTEKARSAIARAEAALAEPQPDAESAMTRDDVIRVAREADIEFQAHTGTLCRLNVTTCGSQPLERIERFAHLVIADFLKSTGQYVTNDASREAATKEAVAPWKTAVIDQLIIAHIFTAEHESDPLKAIQDLLAYHADIAVDPRVSGAAAKLVEQAKAEVESAATERANERANASWALMCEKMVAAEREACANVLDEGWFRCQADAVAAIRARGHK